VLARGGFAVNERVTTIAVALAALGFCAALFWPHRAPVAGSRPVTTAAGPSGLEGVYTWLRRGHVSVRSLRRHYRRLSRAGLASRGNLLLVTLPALRPADAHEVARLRRWLRRGNDALVMVALDDAPGWSRGRSERPALRFVRQLTGARLVPACRCRTGATAWRPRGRHPLLRGVYKVVPGPGPGAGSSRWHLRMPAGRAVLHLLAGPDGHGGLWELRVGRGRVWISTAAGLLSNAALASPGNARLAANLVHLALRPGGAVVVDDMHQGLTRVYDPGHFFSDPRLHWTIGFLVGFWLLYVAGRSGRLGRLADERPAAAAADLAFAAGGLYARALRPAAATLERLRHFRRQLRPRLGWIEGERLWQRLAETPGVSADDVRALRTLEQAAHRGARVSLVRVHNLCLRIDQELK